MMVAGGIVDWNDVEEVKEVLRVFYIVERVKGLIHRK
jgi:hypothetical protein